MTIFPGPFCKATPLRVFVVEDHPVSAEYLRRHLELLGHSVVCAETMQEALEKLP